MSRVGGVVALIGVGAVGLGGWSYAGGGSTGHNAGSATGDIDISGPFLQHLTKDPHDPKSADRCGEPEITQDVRDPKTLVMACMSSAGLNYQSPQPASYLTWSYKDVTQTPNWHQPCYTFISHDGGKKWSRDTVDPVNSSLVTACADPLAAQGPKGEIYLGGDGIHYPVNGKDAPKITAPGWPVPREPLGIAFTRSLDGGKTFSRPTIIPTANDRPLWTVDQTTGAIYDVSGCGTYDPATGQGDYGCTPTSRNLAVSTDQGRTWSPSVSVWNKQTPTTTLTPGRLHNIGGAFHYLAAAHGVFAMAGVDGRVGEEDATPPPSTGGSTVTFKYSVDNGTTFTERGVPLSGAMSSCSTPSVEGLAADPAHSGTFALLLLCTPNARAAQVLVTHDLGATWVTAPSLAVVPPPDYRGNPSNFGINRPWIAYGPTGSLGVMWRETYGAGPFGAEGPQPGPQDVFLALSGDGGKTFGNPFRLNSAGSPPPDPRMFFGDDLSHLVLDRNNAYVVWGDWRSGELQSWFRTVPLHSS